jgi:hypothetical protein
MIDVKQQIVAAYNDLPASCRYAPASQQQLVSFECEFGSIPDDYRWFLTTCGGGVCGAEWLDGIEQLPKSHRKFGADGWTMKNVFVIGWDGAGNPMGIHRATGKVLTEDHNFGGIHKIAESFLEFLVHGYDVDL